MQKYIGKMPEPDIFLPDIVRVTALFSFGVDVSVVEFRTAHDPKPEEAPAPVVVWQCYTCDSQTFYLHSTGDVECAGCGAFHDRIRCFCPDEKPL